MKHAGRARGGLFIAYRVTALMLSEKPNRSRDDFVIGKDFLFIDRGCFLLDKEGAPYKDRFYGYCKPAN
jgi:hypothetical protein